MIDENIIKLLEEHSKNRPSYLSYINNIDLMYDRDFLLTLYTIMKLQKENLEMAMALLYDRDQYLNTLTYIIKIIVERHNGENDTVNYYIYPQITPNIPNGDKLTFTKAGTWFKDEAEATAFADILRDKYIGSEIVKTLI
jgi:hypothetical protein